MKHNRNFEYIASSAGGFMRLALRDFFDSQRNVDFFKKEIDKFAIKTDHKFSGLYNAFVQRRHGEKLKKYYDNLTVYADSGGLQVVTLGKEIDDELKKKIYYHQSFSDYSFCFDEIPTRSSNEKSERNTEYKTRIYDPSFLKECAKKTGENLKEQFKYFEDVGSASEPILIIQGNSSESYKTWLNVVMDTMGQDFEKLNSVAMGAAALGQGLFENIQRSFFYKHVYDNTKIRHVHFLAIGSKRKLLANIALLLNTNIFPDDLEISYDSTSHTMEPHFGFYTMKGKKYNYNRKFSPIYRKIYKDLKDRFEDFPLQNEKELHQHLALPNTVKDRHLYSLVSNQTILGAIWNFIEDFEETIKKEKLILTGLSEKSPYLFRPLLYLKDEKEFLEWEDEVKFILDSRKIKEHFPSTLDQFFT